MHLKVLSHSNGKMSTRGFGGFAPKKILPLRDRLGHFGIEKRLGETLDQWVLIESSQLSNLATDQSVDNRAPASTSEMWSAAVRYYSTLARKLSPSDVAAAEGYYNYTLDVDNGQSPERCAFTKAIAVYLESKAQNASPAVLARDHAQVQLTRAIYRGAKPEVVQVFG